MALCWDIVEEWIGLASRLRMVDSRVNDLQQTSPESGPEIVAVLT
jgi:hypothetical protein